MARMAFCDFSKAFNAFWLHKLDRYWIGTDLLRWFNYYLTDGEQKVKYKNGTSSGKKIKAGVSQWSALGPLLCLVYINDMSKTLTALTRLFTDDTSFKSNSPDPEDIKTVIDTDPMQPSNYLMTFNSKQTEIVIFHNWQWHFFQHFNNQTISTWRLHKHLCSNLSSDGNWIRQTILLNLLHIYQP